MARRHWNEIKDDPWGEIAVAARQALRPRDVVRDHLEALEISSELTRWFRKQKEPNVLHVTVENVLAALKKAKICCVLMGTHAINTYRSEARATQDVDVLVTKKDVRKAIRVLEEAFPYLEVLDSQVVARFLNLESQKVVLDVMKPAARAIQIVFRHTIPIGKSHRIPTLEMTLASKFVAMIAPNRRRDKKMIDLGDFMNAVINNRDRLDLEKLRHLGDIVHPRGGDMILGMVEKIDGDLPIHLD